VQGPCVQVSVLTTHCVEWLRYLLFCTRFAACFGCLITILSLGYSTLTQQLISIELLPTANTTSPGNLPRSEAYHQLALEDQRYCQYYLSHQD
jgi:hypothetical protein